MLLDFVQFSVFVCGRYGNEHEVESVSNDNRKFILLVS